MPSSISTGSRCQRSLCTGLTIRQYLARPRSSLHLDCPRADSSSLRVVKSTKRRSGSSFGSRVVLPRRPLSGPDRKSTRLNSSHGSISYAVFCLKKKKKTDSTQNERNKRKDGASVP